MIEFLIKYKIHILVIILGITFFRSCAKSRNISKLEKLEISCTNTLDSLNNIIILKNARLDSIPEILKAESLSIYLSLDDTISRVDRTPQLMGFHTLIKDKIKDIQND
jgi:hypothetical protein